MRVTIRTDLVHLCPFRDEVDHGTLEASYEWEPPGKPPIEFHAFRTTLDQFREQKVTHEELTAHLAREFQCRIVTTWTTAGMTIICEAD